MGNIVNPFGTLSNGVNALSNSSGGSGLVYLITVIYRMAVLIAGIYTLLQFVLAGFSFLNAGGDPKAVQKAWERIWQSVLGLVIIVAAIILAGLIGFIFFNDASFIISPRIYRS